MTDLFQPAGIASFPRRPASISTDCLPTAPRRGPSARLGRPAILLAAVLAAVALPLTAFGADGLDEVPADTGVLPATLPSVGPAVAVPPEALARTTPLAVPPPTAPDALPPIPPGLARALAMLPADGTASPLTSAESLRAEALRYEHGEGVTRDPLRAATLYCQAARQGDAASQFNLGWIYAHGRGGIERNDAWAAYFFKAAAERGIPQAGRMLDRMGGATSVRMPDCMRPPALPVAVGPAAAAPTAALLPKVKLVTPKAIVEMVGKLAPAYGIEPQLVLAIMQVESNYNVVALSPKNAMGLMQLIPETAERFQVKDPFDPKQNIRGGLAYLRWLLAYFEGDVSLVAAAYNAGEGAVNRHRGVPPYAETRNYVSRVLGAVGLLAHPFNAAVAKPSPQLGLIRRLAATTVAAQAGAPAVRAR